MKRMLMSPEDSKEILAGKRPRGTRGWKKEQTYHLLLGGDEPGLFLQLGVEGMDLALGLGSCCPLVLRQGSLEPFVLLLQLVGTQDGGLVKC